MFHLAGQVKHLPEEIGAWLVFNMMFSFEVDLKTQKDIVVIINKLSLKLLIFFFTSFAIRKLCHLQLMGTEGSLFSLPCCFSQRFTRRFLSHLCPASKPIWCFSVHHWLVNTVQRSPFLKNAVLTTGDSNFAIWRESVLVTTPVSSTTTAPKL